MKKFASFLIILAFVLSVHASNDLVEYDVSPADGFWNYQTTVSEICSQKKFDIDGVGSSCQDQLRVACENRDILWTMLDASSKFPWAGLNYSSLLNFGNYDQCMTIDHKQDLGGKNVRVLGKHCTPGLFIPNLEQTKLYQLAICLPDQCKPSDFNLILMNITQRNLTLFYDGGSCSTVETGTEFSGWDITIFVVFATFFAFLVISTLYDVYLYKAEQRSAHPLLVAFSVLSNGKKLFQTSSVTNKEQILCFHGIKFISMWWIIAGHNISGWTVLPVTNYAVGMKFIDEFRSWYFTAGHLAVETFFYISGFLLAYQYLKQKSQPLKAHVLTVPKLYLHRYLRLTPVVIMLYLYVVGVLRHTGSGPIFKSGAESYRQPCVDYWWTYFLYIQNYYNPTNFCVTHTWYLSVDMQMFILAPIALIPIAVNIKEHFKQTMLAILGIIVFFTVLPLINIIWQDLYYNEYDTHSKLVDYWIGFMLGAYMREKRDKRFKISSILNILIWTFILAAMLAVVLLHKYAELHFGYVGNQVFFTLMRPVWCIGLSWIVFACHHGYGGIVNWLLSTPLMQIGSKLTYCIYLTHGQVIAYYILTGRTIKYFTDYAVFYEWCGTFIMSLVTATIATLTFESPIIAIERLIFGGSKRIPPPKANVQQPPTNNNESFKTLEEQA